MVLFLLDSQTDGDCQLIPPVHKVSFLSFLIVFGLDMLCHFVVSYCPCPQGSRVTGIGFQLLNLNQTVSHIRGNLSTISVAEFAVIASATLI
jgi:hypothetical protein